MITPTPYLLSLMLALLLCLPFSTPQALYDSAIAAEPISNQATLSKESVSAALEQLHANTTIDDVSKNSIEQLYQSTLQTLQTATEYQIKAQSYQQQYDEGAQHAQRIERQRIERQRIELLAPSNKLAAFSASGELAIHRQEQQLLAEKSKLLVLENGLSNLNQTIQQQTSRPREIRIAQQSLADQQRALAAQLNSLDATHYDNYLAYTAESFAIQANRLAVTAEQEMLASELQSHPVNMQLLNARYHYAIAEIAAIRANIEQREAFLHEHKETEANRFSREMTEALQAAAGKHPVIVDAIRKNMDLSNEYSNITQAITVANSRQNEIERLTKQISAQAKKAETLLSLADISPKLASLLRKQRRELFSTIKIAMSADTQLQQIGEISIRRFEIEESLNAFQDMDTALDQRLVAHISDNDSDTANMETKVELQLLLDQQHAQLEKINQAYSSYFAVLEELEFATQQLTTANQHYANYLDKNLLWVKSAPPISSDFLMQLGAACKWLVSPQQWRSVLTTLYSSASKHWIWSSLCLSLILGLMLSKASIKRRLLIIVEKVGFAYTDRFSYTLKNMLLIILQVLPVVAVMYYVGWLLRSSADSSNFASALGYALKMSCVPLFFLQSFYRFFSPLGIANKHLRWPERSVAMLRRQFSWLRYVGVVWIFLISLTLHQPITSYSDSLGRLVLILLLITMSVVLAIIMRPYNGVLRRHLHNNQQSVLFKTRYLWYPALIIIPLVVALFAASGYFASALELQQRLITSMRVVLVAIIIHELALRGLRLYNRDQAVIKYREKKLAEKTQQVSGESGETTLPADPNELHISTINKQTKRLLGISVVSLGFVVFWLVWKDLLPALGIFDDWVLWETASNVNGSSSMRATTLTNLLLAGLYLTICSVAIKNLPGVLEVLILNRLSLDTGSRFALNQLINYSLIAITIAMVASELGGQWKQVQWLVAALGLGLGFGLQEIFANFVSGIILLFERPIRIGDVVTIGETTGTVSRIQIRATTITDWDRKELLVPNKNFITNELVNWTRTDCITRIVIQVGVAYGSDTELVHKLLVEVLQNHPLVLKDPQAMVFFIGFGDSSLDFELRLFFKDVIQKWQITHDVHMSINQAFHQHGIEIPFPQRDLHLRSTDAVLNQGLLVSSK